MRVFEGQHGMGENRNVQEVGGKVEEGQCEASKSNGQLLEGHVREREGKWAAVACCSARLGDGIYMVLSWQGQFVLYAQEWVNREKETEVSEVQVDLATNCAMSYNNKSGVQIEVNKCIGLLCDSGHNVEKTAM